MKKSIVIVLTACALWVFSVLTGCTNKKSAYGPPEDEALDVDTVAVDSLDLLAESATTDLSKEQNPQGYSQSAKIAKKGASVAKVARNKLESQLGHSVISPNKAADYLPPADKTEDPPEPEE